MPLAVPVSLPALSRLIFLPEPFWPELILFVLSVLDPWHIFAHPTIIISGRHPKCPHIHVRMALPYDKISPFHRLHIHHLYLLYLEILIVQRVVTDRLNILYTGYMLYNRVWQNHKFYWWLYPHFKYLKNSKKI